MLIQHNSHSLLTKYISICLRENYYTNTIVTDYYNNSIYNVFEVDQNIIANNYIAFPVYTNNVITSYNYGYVLGYECSVLSSTYTNDFILQDNANTLPYLYFGNTDTLLTYNRESKTGYFNLGIKALPGIKVIKIDRNTGDFIKDEGNNLVLYTDEELFNIPEIPNDDEEIYAEALCSSSNCRATDELCYIIYKWLKDKYPCLLKNNIGMSEYNTKVFYGDIANYFIYTNKYFNPNKLAFDIDDLVGSFLFGRVITDTSSPEDIEYVQNLFKYNKDYGSVAKYYIKYPGRWGEIHNLIYQYQCKLNERFIYLTLENDVYWNNLSPSWTPEQKQAYKEQILAKTDNLFNVVIPTGYLDPITERYLRLDYIGDDANEYNQEGRTSLRTY